MGGDFKVGGSGFPSLIAREFNCIEGSLDKRGEGHSRTTSELENSRSLLARMV